MAVNTVDYRALRAGDITPDGMIFVGVYKDEETGKERALLRTEFNRMSGQYEAVAKAELEKQFDRRLPTNAELYLISKMIKIEEIKKMRELGDAFAWSSKSYGRDYADGMDLDGGIPVLFTYRNDPGYVCFVRSADF